MAKPRWEMKSALHRAREGHRLALRHRAALEPRLSPGLIEGLGTDLERLGGRRADRAETVTTQKGTTGRERDVAEEAHNWVLSIRNMARRTDLFPHGDRKALGVGEKLSPDDTGRVIGAIAAILKLGAERPDVLRRIGVLEEDLPEGRQLGLDLGGADSAQAAIFAVGKDRTFDKNVVQLRIEAAIDEISSRGAMALRQDAQERERFEDLVAEAGPKPQEEEARPPSEGEGAPAGGA